MKKRTFIYSMMLLGTLSFSSCTDMLDKEPLDNLQMVLYFGTILLV